MLQVSVPSCRRRLTQDVPFPGYHYDDSGINESAPGYYNAINYNSVDVDDYYNDTGADAGFDCGGEFDDCSAFAAADAFAIF